MAVAAIEALHALQNNQVHEAMLRSCFACMYLLGEADSKYQNISTG